jgi:hypothetical protein
MYVCSYVMHVCMYVCLSASCYFPQSVSHFLPSSYVCLSLCMYVCMFVCLPVVISLAVSIS